MILIGWFSVIFVSFFVFVFLLNVVCIFLLNSIRMENMFKYMQWLLFILKRISWTIFIYTISFITPLFRELFHSIIYENHNVIISFELLRVEFRETREKRARESERERKRMTGFYLRGFLNLIVCFVIDIVWNGVWKLFWKWVWVEKFIYTYKYFVAIHCCLVCFKHCMFVYCFFVVSAHLLFSFITCVVDSIFGIT